jgi:hypothetical protein
LWQSRIFLKNYAQKPFFPLLWCFFHEKVIFNVFDFYPWHCESKVGNTGEAPPWTSPQVFTTKAKQSSNSWTACSCHKSQYPLPLQGKPTPGTNLIFCILHSPAIDKILLWPQIIILIIIVFEVTIY